MTDMLEGKQFSIDSSNSFIFDLLRSKIYENPIAAICRELCANARDANRSVGKDNVPIEVTLPTNLNAFFKVKDEGPGISPDIIENVFIKYAASTKRDKDNQTGGFGLGAKTPFAYKDSFTIITVVDGVKYQYLCYIDETKIGKISLLDKSDTDEPSGTEIIVAVNNYDFEAFKNAFIKSVFYWDVKPKANVSLADPFYIIKKEKWSLESRATNGYINLLIDGISYSTNFIRPDIRNVNFLFHFKRDDVSLTPSREYLHLDEKTKIALNDRLVLLKEELKQELENEISNLATFSDACQWLAQKSDLVKFCGFVAKWKGIEIPNGNYYYIYSNSPFLLSVDISNRGGSLKRDIKTSNYFYFDKKSYINDINIDVSKLDSIKRSLASNFSESCQIVLNKDVIPNNHLFSFDKLSDLMISLKEKSLKSKISLMKFSNGFFSRSSVKEFESSNNQKIVVLIRDKKEHSFSNLHLIEKDYDIFGINESLKDKFEKSFSDYQFMQDFIEDSISANKEEIIKYLKLKYEMNSYSRYMKTSYMLYNSCETIKSKLTKPIKYIDELYNYKNKKSFNTNRFFEFLYSNSKEDLLPDIETDFSKEVNEANSKIRSLELQFIEEYPMLNFVSSYVSIDNQINIIVEYINEKTK